MFQRKSEAYNLNNEGYYFKLKQDIIRYDENPSNFLSGEDTKIYYEEKKKK